MSDDCSQNLDPLKLVREGTNQSQRYLPELAPGYVQVNEHGPEHGMVFAQAYAAFLKFYDANHSHSGNWQGFFAEDISVKLATIAIDDIETYRSNVKTRFDFLNNLDNQSKETELKQSLGYLFTMLATLAQQFDKIKSSLPEGVALKPVLKNLIMTKLAPALKDAIAAYKAGHAHSLIVESQLTDVRILGGVTVSFESVKSTGLSEDWIPPKDAGSIYANWHAYVQAISSNHAIYGTPSIAAIPDVFERVNHVATHSLFTGIFEEFLKVYARVIKEAQLALEDSYKNQSNHQPHYALFIAFLRLFEHARGEINTITQRHLDFYYREILQLKEKPALPAKAHVLVQLAKQADTHEIAPNTLFQAGKDKLEHDVFFANARQLVANQAQVVALKTVYRHGDEKIAGSEINAGRIYASPMANSEDGNGAELIDVNHAWHPFFNKQYQDGKLTEINMPQASIGFAVASHYLLLAEGSRKITLTFTCLGGTESALTSTLLSDFRCLLTTKEGWFEVKPAQVTSAAAGKMTVDLSGADPAIVPFDAKVHGTGFNTHLPVIQLLLRHHDATHYAYQALQDVKLQKIDLTVSVDGLRTLAISNDFGPVDASQPFMPFGALPNGGESLIVGSKEIFQKTLTALKLKPRWQGSPSAYPTTTVPTILVDYLHEGQWKSDTSTSFGFSASSATLVESVNNFVLINEATLDKADFTDIEPYNTKATHGFIKLKLNAGFGFSAYQLASIVYAQTKAAATSDAQKTAAESLKPTAIVPPVLSELTMDYKATQTINLSVAAGFDSRVAHYYHLAPFGYAEQHAYLRNAAIKQDVYLLPQFKWEPDISEQDNSEAEFYIGIANLKPPQSLSLLFQVLDGTADPTIKKPPAHIHWSYLSQNEWYAFEKYDVEDGTAGLLNSGIITFAMPRAATDDNAILASGLHWIRACVTEKSAAACQLQLVAAQGLEVTLENHANDVTYQSNDFAANTITQLNDSNADVKSISQPFASFGGRPAESAGNFYTRVSERLRHKDRAIALWDYERLILEAFPQIYQVKCLNHTQYEPKADGTIIYRELAPGHVTIIAIPNIKHQSAINPLRPNTSLGLLEEIKQFLTQRLSGFVQLHVANPEFEEVKLEFNLRLYDGFDESFYVKKLQETLTQYLSPWAVSHAGGVSPSFGGHLYKSVLINFIEDLPYVDYVTDVKLIHRYIDATGTSVSAEGDEVAATKALSILVSVPASGHLITVIPPLKNTQDEETACGCKS